MAVKVVLVGCGNMGHAMLTGWLASGKLAASEIAVVEPNEALRQRASQTGAGVSGHVSQLQAGVRPILIIFAVKPQVMRSVVAEYSEFATGATTFVSIAAGIDIALFETLLGEKTPIARCMPNTPAAIGKGMMVTVSNSQVTPAAETFLADLLSVSGKVLKLEDESLMDAVTAVSGSGPAYVFHFIECLTAAGEQAGLPAEAAKLLAMQTVFGAASLAAESESPPGVLREQVTSPNGTTAAALQVLMKQNRLRNLVAEAVEAARDRSIELGK